MSPFLLRPVIAAACVVALSSSVAAAQGASSPSVPGVRVSSRVAPSLAPPSVTAPRVIVPPAVTSSIADPPRGVGHPVVVAPAATIPELLAPKLETISASPVNADVASVMRRREAFSRPQVLMITGGALLLTGLLVDGDASSILIIAGAGIGGYGLYLYLQTPDARFDR